MVSSEKYQLDCFSPLPISSLVVQSPQALTPRPRVYRNCLKTRKSASVFFATAVSAVVAAPLSWCRQSCQLAEDPPSLPTILANHRQPLNRPSPPPSP